MRTITIIGAGQAGLQLGLGLLRHGYHVTLVSDRTPEQILHGGAAGTAALFGNALEMEYSLGCNDWPEAPFINGIIFELYPPDEQSFCIKAPLTKPMQAVDQRLKHAHWLQGFSEQGGRVLVQPATMNDLETYAATSDLVIVAAGAQQFPDLFARDETRCEFTQPQRQVALVNVVGMVPWGDPDFTPVKASILPGIGEVFYIPFYAKSACPAGSLVIEAVPGSALDYFCDARSGAEMLDRFKAVIHDVAPWDYDHIEDATLTDDFAWLRGAITPTVRQPIGQLPSGAVIMGIGDVVILNDPIMAQGANNATKYAHFLTKRVVDRREQPFDRAWMQDVFAAFWDYSRYANALSNLMLRPLAPHLQRILHAASHHPEVAADLFAGFNDPPSLFPWFADPDEAEQYLALKGIEALDVTDGTQSLASG